MSMPTFSKPSALLKALSKEGFVSPPALETTTAETTTFLENTTVEPTFSSSYVSYQDAQDPDQEQFQEQFQDQDQEVQEDQADQHIVDLLVTEGLVNPIDADTLVYRTGEKTSLSRNIPGNFCKVACPLLYALCDTLDRKAIDRDTFMTILKAAGVGDDKEVQQTRYAKYQEPVYKKLLNHFHKELSPKKKTKKSGNSSSSRKRSKKRTTRNDASTGMDDEDQLVELQSKLDNTIKLVSQCVAGILNPMELNDQVQKVVLGQYQEEEEVLLGDDEDMLYDYPLEQEQVTVAEPVAEQVVDDELEEEDMIDVSLFVSDAEGRSYDVHTLTKQEPM